MVRNDADPEAVLAKSQAIARLRGMCENDEQVNAVDALQKTNAVYFRNEIMHVSPLPSRPFTPLPSPCYSITHTLLGPLELPSNVLCKGRKTDAEMQCTFEIPRDLVAKLSSSITEFPRTEVQLRFFNTSGTREECPDELPLKCSVKINDREILNLRSLSDSSRPLMITECVMRARKEKALHLTLNWTADIRKWAVAIYEVKRVNWEMVHDRVTKSPRFELPYEKGEAAIRNSFNDDDDSEVSMDSLKVSLICPMGKTRMQIAARFRECTHIKCFDLDSYLQMNEGRLVWTCCICGHKAFSVDCLVIDKYLTHLVENEHRSAIEVEMKKDGSKRAIREDGTEAPSSKEEEEEREEKVIMMLSDDIELIKDSDFIVINNEDPLEDEDVYVIAAPPPAPSEEIVFIKTVRATEARAASEASNRSSESGFSEPSSLSTISSMLSPVTVTPSIGMAGSASIDGDTVPAANHENEVDGQITATPTRSIPRRSVIGDEMWFGMPLHPGAKEMNIPQFSRPAVTPAKQQSSPAAPINGIGQNNPVLRRSKRLSEKVSASLPPKKIQKMPSVPPTE